MNDWLIALCVVCATICINQIVSHISYAVCWKNCDNDMKELLLNKKSQTQTTKKEGK